MTATIPAVKTEEENLVKKAEPRAKVKKNRLEDLFSVSREPLEQAKYAVTVEERETFDFLESVLSVR